MSWANSEIVSVLVFLLPGFVAAAVFYSLTSYAKPNEFGQIVQALVFTIVGQLTAWILRQLISSGAAWPKELEAIVSVISAVFVALIVVYISNNDIAHRFFRRIGITRETSYLSEWYSSFTQNTDCYVILNLKDERRLFGWPSEWPSRSGQGHFRLTEAVWLLEDEKGCQSHTEPEIYEIVVSALEVDTVEFLKAEEGESD